MPKAPERIQTLHPEPGKAGVNIDRRLYDAMARALLAQRIARDVARLFYPYDPEDPRHK